jgi:uncharacterized protein YceH (UPF0502 family)
MDPDAVELRVLGCLIEKQRTVPDSYPLSINALRLACNQSTNRDPVVDYDEHSIRQALERLHRRRWTRLTSTHGSRAAKYRHLLDEALDLRDDELSVLAVLMLRGPQTPGELKARTERMYPFESLLDVQAVLDRLIDRELVRRFARRPGQKEERYGHLLGGEEMFHEPPSAAAPLPAGATSPAPVSVPASASPPARDGLAERVEQLEEDVRSLRAALDALRGELGVE